MNCGEKGEMSCFRVAPDFLGPWSLGRRGLEITLDLLLRLTGQPERENQEQMNVLKRPQPSICQLFPFILSISLSPLHKNSAMLM